MRAFRNGVRAGGIRPTARLLEGAERDMRPLLMEYVEAMIKAAGYISRRVRAELTRELRAQMETRGAQGVAQFVAGLDELIAQEAA